MRDYEQRLSGGHPNSLGNTVEVVEEVLNNPDSLEELYNCYFSEDEVVRLRVSSAMKRISQSEPKLLHPYLDKLLDEISKIDQASTQWTLAILYMTYDSDFTESQKLKAKEIVMNNLRNHNDWIVLNTSMETAFFWSKSDAKIKSELIELLNIHMEDKRRSVSNRAKKYLNSLTN